MTKLSAYLQHLQRFGIRPGLERVRALLTYAGDPQQSYPIVLVGGTNGKGSTCEFLARTLAASGHRTGLYTSPHIYDWNERIRVMSSRQFDSIEQPSPVAPSGRPETTPSGLFPGIISDAALDDLFHASRPALEAVAADLGQPTEFETMTFLGLWHFARSNIQRAVVEVGLGGRWDATNATEPTVSVITHVALDHCDRLGATVEAIAADKVEIARPGRILVTAETQPAVLSIFRAHCDAIGAWLWPVLAPRHSNDAARLNASLALLGAAPLADGGFQQLNWYTAEAARLALATALGEPLAFNHSAAMRLEVPGRTEALRDDPLLLLDAANNPDGAAHLAGYLQANLTERRRRHPQTRLLLVLGILADKDYVGMVECLAPLANGVIATRSDSPRAAAAGDVARVAARHCSQVEVVEPVTAAVARALELALPVDMICITGSFTTIAEVDRQAV